MSCLHKHTVRHTTPLYTMSRFLVEESERDLIKTKIRGKGQEKNKTESDGNLVVLDVSRRFVMTPEYLQSRLAIMGCQTSIAGLHSKLELNYPIESSRLSVLFILTTFHLNSFFTVKYFHFAAIAHSVRLLGCEIHN